MATVISHELPAAGTAPILGESPAVATRRGASAASSAEAVGALATSAVGIDGDSRFIPLLAAARGYGAVADAALEDLLTALCDPIRRYAAGCLRKRVDAGDIVEDVVQETLIRLAKGIRVCRATSDGQVLSWARTTAHHALIDMYRSPSSGLAAQQLAQELVEEIQEHALWRGEAAPAPSSPAMAQLIAVVMAAYNDAVEATGELFWWRLIMGLEWTEIAAKFSTSAAGAKRRFQRAQDTLRREVIRRVDALPAPERADVLALLTRFGYAESLMADAVDGGGPPAAESGVASDRTPAELDMRRRTRAPALDQEATQGPLDDATADLHALKGEAAA